MARALLFIIFPFLRLSVDVICFSAVKLHSLPALALSLGFTQLVDSADQQRRGEWQIDAWRLVKRAPG